MTKPEKALRILREAALAEGAGPVLVYAARYLLAEYDRALLPDWVAALGGGNVDVWPEVLAVARDDMAQEEPSPCVPLPGGEGKEGKEVDE